MIGGAAVICYDDEHLGINSIVETLPVGIRFWIYAINRVLMIALMLIIAGSSGELIEASHKTFSAALKMPLSYWRLAAPAGCLLTAFFYYLYA